MRGLLFTLCLVCGCASPSRDSWPTRPSQGELIWSDVPRFWKAFDQLDSPEARDAFQAYLDGGTSGLADFVPGRIESAEALHELVLAERAYYESIRASSLRVSRHEAQIRAVYAALEYDYPDAVFPPVYFVIGRTTSGGTASENGMIIGLECFSDEPIETEYGRPAMASSLIPYIVAHELVHFLQPESSDRSLLARCLREGSADFIGEKIAGSPVLELNGPTMYAYGDAHEADLWREFETVLHGEDVSGWLYSKAPPGRPQNLGYWVGYQIAEAYYERASDKRRALAEILRADDAAMFLRRSGYRGSLTP